GALGRRGARCDARLQVLRLLRSLSGTRLVDPARRSRRMARPSAPLGPTGRGGLRRLGGAELDSLPAGGLALSARRPRRQAHRDLFALLHGSRLRERAAPPRDGDAALVLLRAPSGEADAASLPGGARGYRDRADPAASRAPADAGVGRVLVPRLAAFGRQVRCLLPLLPAGVPALRQPRRVQRSDLDRPRLLPGPRVAAAADPAPDRPADAPGDLRSARRRGIAGRMRGARRARA